MPRRRDRRSALEQAFPNQRCLRISAEHPCGRDGHFIFARSRQNELGEFFDIIHSNGRQEDDRIHCAAIPGDRIQDFIEMGSRFGCEAAGC